MKTLAFLHTSHTLCPLFEDLAAKYVAPDTRLLHFVDDSAIKNTIQAGKLEKPTMRRVIAMAGAAFEAGADVAMYTCSSIGPAVDMAIQLYDKPVLRVDRPMAEKAVLEGKTIGVAATLSTTLGPTAELVANVSRDLGRPVEIKEALCEGAFEAVMSGDGETHDQIVSEHLINGLADVDVIVLAQASMARVVEKISKDQLRAPVYSSPELGTKRAGEVLNRISA